MGDEIGDRRGRVGAVAHLVPVVLAVVAMLVTAGCGNPNDNPEEIVRAPSAPQCLLTCGTRTAIMGSTPVTSALPLPIPTLAPPTPAWTAFAPDAQPALAPRAVTARDEVWNPRDLFKSFDDEMFRVDVNGFMSIERQDASGRWGAVWETLNLPGDVRPGGNVEAVGVSLASANQALHVCGVLSNGTVVHGMRTNPPLEQPQNPNDFRVWEDLESEIVHADLGQIVDVTCVGVRTPTATDDLHILALSDDGQVWHTRGTGPNGDQFASWSAATSVQLAGAPADGFSSIDAAVLPGGGLALVGLTRADPDKRRVLRATRPPSGNWTAASDLVAGAPTVIATLPKRDFVVVTNCQSGVAEGRWRLVVLVGEYGPPAQVAFTVVSAGEEDWDAEPLTAPSYTRPWDDVRRPLPYPLGGVSVAERPIAATPPTP